MPADNNISATTKTVAEQATCSTLDNTEGQLQEYALLPKGVYKLLRNHIWLFQTVALAVLADALLNRLGRIIKPRQTASLLNRGHQLMVALWFWSARWKDTPTKSCYCQSRVVANDGSLQGSQNFLGEQPASCQV